MSIEKARCLGGDHALLNAGHHGFALAERQPDRFQPVVALVEMQNLVHADHAVVVTNDPELDLNTHAHPKGCRCCSGQPIRRRRRELPQISQALTCSRHWRPAWSGRASTLWRPLLSPPPGIAACLWRRWPTSAR